MDGALVVVNGRNELTQTGGWQDRQDQAGRRLDRVEAARADAGMSKVQHRHGLSKSRGLGLMSTLLYGVAPYDPATFGAVVVMLAVVALAACGIPARRAIRIPLSVALRS